MRCHICNFSDFSQSDCHDLSDEVPGRNSVHYRKDLKEDVCSYCYSIITKNRKFYLSWAADIDEKRKLWPNNMKGFFKPPQQTEDNDNGRPEQKDQEKPPALRPLRIK